MKFKLILIQTAEMHKPTFLVTCTRNFKQKFKSNYGCEMETTAERKFSSHQGRDV